MLRLSGSWFKAILSKKFQPIKAEDGGMYLVIPHPSYMESMPA
jgi:hypothetical protein